MAVARESDMLQIDASVIREAFADGIPAPVTPIKRITLTPLNSNLPLPPGSPRLEHEETHSPELTSERHARLSFTIIFPILLMIILFCAKTIPNITRYHAIALTLSCALVIWAMHLIFVILSFKHLHYIRIRRKPVHTHLFIPYAYEEKEYVPMSSISLILAIRGSNVEMAGNKFFNITYGLIFCAVCMKWIENQTNDITNDIELIMLLISAFGMFIIPLWYLEAYSKLSNFMHYISTTLFAICAPLSFCLYQEWSEISVILLCVSYVNLFVWLGAMEYVQRKEYKEENRDMVHKYSLFVLLTELFGLICSYSTFIAFIYCMSDDTIL